MNNRGGSCDFYRHAHPRNLCTYKGNQSKRYEVGNPDIHKKKNHYKSKDRIYTKFCELMIQCNFLSKFNNIDFGVNDNLSSNRHTN